MKTKRILLPGDHLSVKTHLPDQEILVEATNSNNWPPPTLASIKNHNMDIHNTTTKPILIDGKSTLSLKLTPTTQTDMSDPPHNTHYYNHYSPQQPQQLPDSDTINLIKFGKTDPSIRALLESAHRKFRDVFNKDLSNGYNRYYGRHLYSLNWTSMQRPTARKIPIAGYSHELKGVMQEICDDLTDQGVLKVPQQHNIIVQSVCPSFLRRKRKVADIPTHLLTKNDVRLLINFAPVNDLIKNIPSPMVTTDDLYCSLGRWKEIIVMTLKVHSTKITCIQMHSHILV